MLQPPNEQPLDTINHLLKKLDTSWQGLSRIQADYIKAGSSWNARLEELLYFLETSKFEQTKSQQYRTSRLVQNLYQGNTQHLENQIKIKIANIEEIINSSTGGMIEMLIWKPLGLSILQTTNFPLRSFKTLIENENYEDAYKLAMTSQSWTRVYLKRIIMDLRLLLECRFLIECTVATELLSLELGHLL